MCYGLGAVATAAIYKLQIPARGVPTPVRVHILVAVPACHVGVNGCHIGLFGDEDRHLFASAGTRKLRVRVTNEASVIVLGQRCGSHEAEDRGYCGEAKLCMTAPRESRVG